MLFSKRSFMVFAFATLAVACSGQSDSNNERNLIENANDYISGYVENGDFSGIAVISRSGDILVNASFGYADIESRSEINFHTSFHIASLSKTFTSAAIMHLVEDGSVSLDESLATYIPNFPDADRITIRHLLRHESGIPDYWTASDIGDISQRLITTDELILWLGKRPLEFAPGSQSRYSNSGYAVLAAVIERVSGQPYHIYLAEHVYPPGALDQTREFRGHADAIGYQPSYEEAGIAPAPTYNPSFLLGAGSLESTPSDLIDWCNEFIRSHRDPDTKHLTYGWGLRKSGGRQWLEQSGRNPGYASHLRAYPDEELCIVVLSNIESESVNSIAEGLASLADGENVLAPVQRNIKPLLLNQMEDLVGQYQIEPGRIVEVRRTAAGLVLAGTSGPFLPLEAIGEDRFFYRQLYVEIEIDRDADENVIALLWGGSYPLPKTR